MVWMELKEGGAGDTAGGGCQTGEHLLLTAHPPTAPTCSPFSTSLSSSCPIRLAACLPGVYSSVQLYSHSELYDHFHHRVVGCFYTLSKQIQIDMRNLFPKPDCQNKVRPVLVLGPTGNRNLTANTCIKKRHIVQWEPRNICCLCEYY